MADLLTMFDDVDTSLLPASVTAVAGYVDGRFANIDAIRARFPDAHVLSIAVFPQDDADALDVEAGDATRADIFGWFKRQQAKGVWRPVVYSSVTNIDGIVATMTANGFHRDDFRLWSAHYTGTVHICSASTCKLTSAQCDGTQYTDRALSRSLDESVLLPGFFGAPKPPPPGPGPFRHVVPAGNTRSLWRVATDRNMPDEAGIIALSQANLNPQNLEAFNAYVTYENAAHAAGMTRPAMGEDLIYYTENQ